MPECDCRRPVTPDGIYHESTCALRLTERDRDFLAENERLTMALRLVLAAADQRTLDNVGAWPDRLNDDAWCVAGRAARHESAQRAAAEDQGRAR